MSQSRSLTPRERQLLLLCFGVLLFMGTLLMVNTFLQKRSKLTARLSELENQKKENAVWLSDAAFWEKRKVWLEGTMPTTDSLGRAQGQLLEELQNEALDLGIKVLRQTLLDPVSTDHFREIAVSLQLYGEQSTILRWISSMQSPDRFQALKELDFELDTRSKEKLPQAQCNLTVARWFKP